LYWPCVCCHSLTLLLYWSCLCCHSLNTVIVLAMFMLSFICAIVCGLFQCKRIKKCRIVIVCLFVLALEIQVTFVCLSQAGTWISSSLCLMVLFVTNELKWEVVVGFVGGIVDHHYLKFLKLKIAHLSLSNNYLFIHYFSLKLFNMWS
jgi:hypothetical protein